MIDPRGGDFYLATSGDRNLTIDRGRIDYGCHDPLLANYWRPGQ
jgi:hypothetical protein